MFNKARPAGAASSKDARAHVDDQSRRYRALELSTDTAHLQNIATGIRFSIISGLSLHGTVLRALPFCQKAQLGPKAP